MICSCFFCIVRLRLTKSQSIDSLIYSYSRRLTLALLLVLHKKDSHRRSCLICFLLFFFRLEFFWSAFDVKQEIIDFLFFPSGWSKTFNQSCYFCYCHIFHVFSFLQFSLVTCKLCSLQVLLYIIFHVIVNNFLHLFSCILFYFILFTFYFVFSSSTYLIMSANIIYSPSLQ